MMSLTKHHGLGNDFLVRVVVDKAGDDGDGEDGEDGEDREDGEDDGEYEDLARRLCNRRTGVGADGLLVAAIGDDAIVMTLYNADGTRAEMSGNGIRCLAHAVARHRGDLEPQRIVTDAGERMVTLEETDDPDCVLAAVDMGEIVDLDEPDGWSTLGVHPGRPVAHLGLGNPHAVVGVDDVGAIDLESLGARVPHLNLEIVEPGPGEDAIRMRVHERGAGITAACGTGAVASAAAARRWGFVAPSVTDVTVHMDGGDATVVLDEPTPGRAMLIGPSTFVAAVEVTAT